MDIARHPRGDTASSPAPSFSSGLSSSDAGAPPEGCAAAAAAAAAATSTSGDAIIANPSIIDGRKLGGITGPGAIAATLSLVWALGVIDGRNKHDFEKSAPARGIVAILR